jgi:hypothetical protein
MAIGQRLRCARKWPGLLDESSVYADQELLCPKRHHWRYQRWGRENLDLLSVSCVAKPLGLDLS